MKKILVEFKDEELGNDLVEYYKDTMNLAMNILYLEFSDYNL